MERCLIFHSFASSDSESVKRPLAATRAGIGQKGSMKIQETGRCMSRREWGIVLDLISV